MADIKPFAGVAQDDSLTLLRQIFRLLKPLGVVVGGGLNTLLVSLAPGSSVAVTGTLTTVTTVTTVTSLTTMQNVNAIGGVTAFDQMKSQNRVAYAVGPRANLNWS